MLSILYLRCCLPVLPKTSQRVCRWYGDRAHETNVAVHLGLQRGPLAFVVEVCRRVHTCHAANRLTANSCILCRPFRRLNVSLLDPLPFLQRKSTLADELLPEKVRRAGCWAVPREEETPNATLSHQSHRGCPTTLRTRVEPESAYPRSYTTLLAGWLADGAASECGYALLADCRSSRCILHVA